MAKHEGHEGKKTSKGGFGKKETGFSGKMGKGHKAFGKEMSPACK